MKRLGFLAVVVLLAACEKVDTGVEPAGPEADFSKYVAMGTSISMGYASDGVNSNTQLASWPRLLANDVGAAFTLPLIDLPGCHPPLAAPLAGFRRVDNTPATVVSTCAANAAGVTLPAQNVAITGQTAADAINNGPNPGNPSARVIPTGQTQLTAMTSQHPTFVSVEFGANELLPALNGLVSNSTATPSAAFSASYQTIINSLIKTDAKALLVLVPTDLSKFPALRTGPEIASQRAAFAFLNVSVNANCDASQNFVSLTKLLAAVAAGAQGGAAFNLSCNDVTGTADGVLTPAEITTLNNLAVQYNTFITTKANENGYATFSLGTLYDTAKNGVTFDLPTILTSTTPFGPNMSLDGIHPSAAGNAILAAAAKAAIIAKYGSITK